MKTKRSSTSSTHASHRRKQRAAKTQKHIDGTTTDLSALDYEHDGVGLIDWWQKWDDEEYMSWYRQHHAGLCTYRGGYETKRSCLSESSQLTTRVPPREEVVLPRDRWLHDVSDVDKNAADSRTPNCAEDDTSVYQLPMDGELDLPSQKEQKSAKKMSRRDRKRQAAKVHAANNVCFADAIVDADDTSAGETDNSRNPFPTFVVQQCVAFPLPTRGRCTSLSTEHSVIRSNGGPQGSSGGVGIPADVVSHCILPYLSFIEIMTLSRTFVGIAALIAEDDVQEEVECGEAAAQERFFGFEAKRYNTHSSLVVKGVNDEANEEGVLASFSLWKRLFLEHSIGKKNPYRWTELKCAIRKQAIQQDLKPNHRHHHQFSSSSSSKNKDLMDPSSRRTTSATETHNLIHVPRVGRWEFVYKYVSGQLDANDRSATSSCQTPADKKKRQQLLAKLKTASSQNIRRLFYEQTSQWETQEIGVFTTADGRRFYNRPPPSRYSNFFMPWRYNYDTITTTYTRMRRSEAFLGQFNCQHNVVFFDGKHHRYWCADCGLYTHATPSVPPSSSSPSSSQPSATHESHHHVTSASSSSKEDHCCHPSATAISRKELWCEQGDPETFIRWCRAKEISTLV